MLSMFMEVKHQQLVIYPVCEVPKTDFYMHGPQLTSTNKSALVIGYLAIGWPSYGYGLAINWL